MSSSLGLSRRDRFSRRAALKALGIGAGALPLLQAGRADAAPFPKRLMILVATNGTIPDAHFPKGDGDALSALTFPEITKPLDMYKADINVLGGVEMKNFTDYPGHGGGHENYSMTFTGNKGVPSAYKDPRWLVWECASPTIDHHIAMGLQKQGAPALAALRMGVQVDKQGSYTAQRRAFWRDVGQPYTQEDSPMKVFATVFGGKPGTNPAFDKLRAERRSMLDFLGKDLAAFGKRLGTDDRRKIDSHNQAVRELEKQLEPGMTAVKKTEMCGSGAPPALELLVNDNYPKIANAHMDLAVAAMACDVTRVVTLQMNNANGEGVLYNWLGIDPKGMEYAQRSSHDIAHRPGPNNRDKIRVEQWHMEMFAGLIKRMKAVPEGAGSMLDNTIILWTNHMGNGGAHNSNQLPWIMAGKGGGYYKTGRYIRNVGSTNGIFVSLANAMGVPTETFGDPKYGGENMNLRG